MDETVTPADQTQDPYLIHYQEPAWEPRRVASPPLGYGVPPVASISRGVSKARKRRAPYVSETGNIWSGPFCILKSEQDQELADSPMWKLRRRSVRYPKGKTIRRLKSRYGCPPSCYAARLASLYDDLPWSYAITLDAPAGRFTAAWNAWSKVLAEWESGPRSEYRGFWLASLAEHPPGNLLHAHLVVGNRTFDQITEGLASWPHGSEVRKVYHRWGILHYTFSGEHDPWRHRRDVFSYCPNVVARFESDNLQWLAYLTQTQILKTASRRALSPSARTRSAKARTAALARWSRPRP